MANKTGTDETRSFDPTPAEVTRELEQGLGVGQRELDAQREPKVDPALIEQADPREEWGQPADEGAAYSANHATRGRKTDELSGPGRKTRAATKDQISRR
ncbi:hypothetical protein [Phenylobacterium sp.]|uniref:hypothetical protein n=1 Tax=Phenylobacterium sp. TaxID=1871053 RepID=UPI002BD1746A|nr:hypothetical protein [Phenylobacterium sp.]HLZ74593.1 hypothetical protein [Phenylobacterium sp.]